MTVPRTIACLLGIAGTRISVRDLALTRRTGARKILSGSWTGQTAHAYL